MAKKYTCTECGDTFTRKWSAQRHIGTSHSGAGITIPIKGPGFMTGFSTPESKQVNMTSRSTLVFTDEILRETARLIARDDYAAKKAAKTDMNDFLLKVFQAYEHAKEGKLDLYKRLDDQKRLKVIDELFRSKSKNVSSSIFDEVVSNMTNANKTDPTNSKSHSTASDASRTNEILKDKLNTDEAEQ